MKLALLIFLAATLPTPGTQYKKLPEGAGKTEVEAACYACHSADLLAQQRITEKQWTATVEKMIRWGAVVPPEKKDVMIQYLSKNFGPKNRFVPLKTGVVK